MKYIPTLLSSIRIPLVIGLFSNSIYIRCAVVVLAMVSDVLDGFIARRFGLTSKLGAIIDPLTDKFFVYMALLLAYRGEQLSGIECLAFVLRDLSLLAFSVTLILCGNLSKHTIAAFFSGKVVTSVQFLILILVSLHIPVPSVLCMLMACFGLASYVELMLRYKKAATTT